MTHCTNFDTPSHLRRAMRIRITKEHGRHRLICTRDDGSFTQGDTGPALPHHDLAHYVAERALGMTQGFFGQIAAGRSIQELGDPQMIRTLPAEAWDAEIIARTLQGSDNGAVLVEDFGALVAAERGAPYPGLTDEVVQRMREELRELLVDWQNVAEGGWMELAW